MSDPPSTDPCPVYDYTKRYIDYDRFGPDGEEGRVDRCERCDWPPSAPHTVAEWRAIWRARSTA